MQEVGGEIGEELYLERRKSGAKSKYIYIS